MHMFKRKRRISLRSLILVAGIVVVVGVVIGTSLFATRLGDTTSGEGLMLTERAIRRAVVQCYAVEGFYPESIDYLKDNYGLVIDEQRYLIHYTCFASNLSPDVTVLERD